jgi:acetyl esterase/lipase
MPWEEETMSTLHLVDPSLRELLAIFPPIDVSPAGRDATRATVIAMEVADMGRDDGLPVTVTERQIDGPLGPDNLRVLIVQPMDAPPAPRGAILHFHGGGYVIGRPEGNLPFLRTTAAAQGCVIVTVDYRLAPETNWQGVVEDGYAALQWMADAAAELGIDPARIGVAGESAGGGLAAAIALIARDRGGPQLAFQHLLYPMLDDRTVTQTDPNPVTGEFIWDRHNNYHGWAAWLGHEPGAAQTSPYAAPARMADLSGLPPTWIGVGTLDLFLEEDISYAMRLIRAGVAVDLVIWPAAYHAFDVDPVSPVAARANADRQAAFARALG